MTVEFSPVPIINRLLTIAQTEAAKNGHIVLTYRKRKHDDAAVYTAECSVCGATIRLTCGAREYSRVGTAYEKPCKPG